MAARYGGRHSRATAAGEGSSGWPSRRLRVATVALRDVSKVFGDGTVAVDNVSLDVADGEFMVLLGPSGCGKSTVLRMIAGLEDPTSGAVLLDGEVANDLAPRERKVAMVFQDFGALPAHVGRGQHRLPAADRRARAGLARRAGGRHRQPRWASATCSARKPGQLSGGQRQRVAMGRAIVRRPGAVPHGRAAVQPRQWPAGRAAGRDLRRWCASSASPPSTSRTTRPRR